MCDILKLTTLSPQTITSYRFYVLGGVLAYICIAVFGEALFGNKRKFFTLFVWVSLSIVFQGSILIASCFTEIGDSKWLEAVSGFLNQATMFYFLFLAPIMIAYAHRAT
jgi:hypothetical protein